MYVVQRAGTSSLITWSRFPDRSGKGICSPVTFPLGRRLSGQKRDNPAFRAVFQSALMG